MPSNLVTLPLRIGLAATRTTISLSTKLAVRAAGGVIDVIQSQGFFPQRDARSPEPADPATAAAIADTPTAEPAPIIPISTAAPADPTKGPARPEPVPAPDELPSTPLTETEAHAKTIDDEDEVVAEFAEPGAEDGAGAQLDLGEPWGDYDADTAETVTRRIADADAAVLAVLELYERAHKGRKTVLEAAERRLRELTPASG